ncbi:MAG: efflux RND transporter permease subunit [Planctomycetes bacterium]|nr:efflux RND transporter permease subunit [Planctomycetota bacterium]
MIARTIRFCLENKLVVALAIVFFLGWGVRVAPFDWDLPAIPRDPVPVDAIPDIGENQQIVFTEWMGRSPQDVEDQISYPMTVALLGIPGVKTVRSYSFFGFSSIYIIFKDDVDFYWSRSRVLEKLASLPAGTLPKGVQPALGPDATALGQVYWYTLEGRDPQGEPTGGWNLDELRAAQDWYVRYALLGAEGISEVASVGGFVQEYQVDVDPDAMHAHGVSLTQVVDAVRSSNLDVGARTIEVNRVEYVVRGLGFVKSVHDLEKVVVKVKQNVPIRIKDVARVSLGPALRRGALDKAGSPAVGGVAVVRYGDNPLAAIKNVKAKIAEIAPGLPKKVVIDWSQTERAAVEAFARDQGFPAYEGAALAQDAWVRWASANLDAHPAWLTLSQVTVVPFYDRTGLIYETLGTLNTALTEEILLSIIVVIAMVLHLRSSFLISGLLPLAVLICFIAMRYAHVDANVVALSGIAIAIGTMVDMGIILCENILRHLDEADPGEDRLEVIYRASVEVGGAVVTAVATTIVSFLPVFAMEAAEGKLFKPLAFTKSFALLGSIVVALTILPPAAHLLFTREGRKHAWHRYVWPAALVALGVAAALYSWVIGLLVLLMSAVGFGQPALERRSARGKDYASWASNGLAVLVVAWFLNAHWLPLGPSRSLATNFLFTGGLIAGVLGGFLLFLRAYPTLLRWCLDHKATFLLLPAVILVLGASVWLGAAWVFPWVPAAALGLFAASCVYQAASVFLRKRAPEDGRPAWQVAAFAGSLALVTVASVTTLASLAYRAGPASGLRTSIEHALPGLGKEFMPPLDEGSYLYMPTTMPHASIGEAQDVLEKLDKALAAVPEVELVVGKLGRAESPLDPAPISMIETIVNYRSEFRVDEDGHRLRFAYDEEAGDYRRDGDGELIPDPDGRPFRQWREHIRSADDIWDELVQAGHLPGTTSAPKLQPIAARIVMLQSGMRAPMGVKVKGPDLATIEQVCLDIERLLKQVPSVAEEAVIADRIVGKPYVELEIDRDAIARHGLKITQVQEIIEVAIGGKPLTTTVEGRERYPVRVRYPRELRDSVEAIQDIYVPTPDGHQIPLIQLAEVRYVRGPQVIKSEDTFLTGYVLFDMKQGQAEVDVVEACQAYLEAKRESGELHVPAGVSYSFAGSYENQLRSEKKLRVVLPLALFIIFVILYLQFKRVSTTALVFSGIAVAWAGGFLMIWLYGQPWFLDVTLLGTNLRELFAVHPINLSVAIWVGFIALFGIASDDGVVIATYLDQSFEANPTESVEGIRAATLEAGTRRIRPCLMTTATTILALVPVLTSTGRGSDIMVPMAIPSFGGMCVELITLFVVPTLYCAIAEFRLGARRG